MKTNHFPKIILAIGIIAVLALGAWYLWQSSPPAYLTESECINTFEYFAYDSMFDDEPFNEETFDTTTGEPWEFVDTVPVNEDISVYYIFAQAIRGSGEKQEMWILKYPKHDNSKIFGYQVYYPNPEKWETIPAEVGNSGVYVTKLFVDSEGTLWGRNSPYPKQDHLTVSEYPILSKFNEQTRQFEFVTDSLKAPVLKFTEAFPNRIVLDEDGIFWIYVQLDGLYRYDPQSGITEKLAAIPDGLDIVENMVLGIDGDLYLNQAVLSLSLQEGEFLRYNTASEELIPIAIPDETWPEEANIFIDHRGNLWLDSAGWRDTNGIWHAMYPDMETFFTALQEPLNLRMAQLIYESSDGILWFRRVSFSAAGTAWYNPESGQGCWFTSEFGSIIEDNNRTLWMVTYYPEYKLYKLNIR